MQIYDIIQYKHTVSIYTSGVSVNCKQVTSNAPFVWRKQDINKFRDKNAADTNTELQFQVYWIHPYNRIQSNAKAF